MLADTFVVSKVGFYVHSCFSVLSVCRLVLAKNAIYLFCNRENMSPSSQACVPEQRRKHPRPWEYPCRGADRSHDMPSPPNTGGSKEALHGTIKLIQRM